MPPSAADVLIVDDDVDMVDSLRDVLTDRGFAVAIARDGQEALDYLAAEGRPRVILLDWMMPRCDGATFRARQKADERIADVPVVVLTADVRVAQRKSAPDVVAVLSKPVELSVLLRLVERFAQSA